MKAKQVKKQLNLISEAVDFLSNLEDEHELSFSDLIKISILYSPQKRTCLLENQLKEKNNWKTVASQKDKGDYIDKDGNYFELKTSATNQRGCINIDQIRLWQEVSYYEVIYWDLKNSNKSKKYILTKDEMAKEVEKYGSASHGTKKANEENKNIEYSIHLPIENEWDNKYKVNFEELNDVL